MGYPTYTDDRDAAKGRVNEIGIASSSGDEFYDNLTQELRNAEGSAEKLGYIAEKAEAEHRQACIRVRAITDACAAYRQAMEPADAR